jgi:hypothetical protein
LTTHETLQAKEQCELFSRDLGTIVQSFLADNGLVFTSKEFNSQLAKFEQVIRFAGTGAHHHNAIAERNIQTIMAIARTMMLHSAVHFGPMWQIHACGQWLCSTLSFCTTTCQVKRQAYLLMTFLPEVDGSSESFMICTFGDALSAVSKRTCMTERSCLAGSPGPIAP